MYMYMFSPYRFALYRKMFERYDKRRDGFITKEELAAVFTGLSINITRNELELLFRIIDRNQSGKIEYSEFLYFFFKVNVSA